MVGDETTRFQGCIIVLYAILRSIGFYPTGKGQLLKDFKNSYFRKIGAGNLENGMKWKFGTEENS